MATKQELWRYTPELERPARQGIFSAGGVVFYPGMNRVDADAIAKVKDLPAVKLRLDAGILTAVTPTEERQAGTRGEEIPQEPSITDFKVVDAVGMIESTSDTTLLRKWQNEDTRLGVQRAIAARLDALEPKPTNPEP